MSHIHPSESAYPVHELAETSGINVRTYIATHALSGMLASPGNPALGAGPGELGLTISQLVAKRSVQYADALIAELNKNESQGDPHAK